MPLLLVHGNLSYYRLARLIKYSFYKNITFAFVLFYYQVGAHLCRTRAAKQAKRRVLGSLSRPCRVCPTTVLCSLHLRC